MGMGGSVQKGADDLLLACNLSNSFEVVCMFKEDISSFKNKPYLSLCVRYHHLVCYCRDLVSMSLGLIFRDPRALQMFPKIVLLICLLLSLPVTTNSACVIHDDHGHRAA